MEKRKVWLLENAEEGGIKLKKNIFENECEKIRKRRWFLEKVFVGGIKTHKNLDLWKKSNPNVKYYIDFVHVPVSY